MNNVAERGFVVGDQVEMIDDQRANVMGGGYGTYHLPRGTIFTVTRLFNFDVVVRGPLGPNSEDRSVQISKTWVRLVDPNRPAPRKLGVKPEGEGIIGIDDPGIQWLWDDMGAYATREGYCSQYDALCIKLGIPGRPREFKVTQTVGDIPITAHVMARSQAEANKHVQDALTGRIPEDIEPAA